MSVNPGDHVGVYQITERIGAGGMGEVYRARDTRLGRDVAVKVLPAAVALDAERRVRFEREARVLSGLNHPNIATLYGVEDSPAGTALVMELVNGQTLADRIALEGPTRSPARVREALNISEQVAAALEAAHEQGVIHRDLKPANVVVRPDGTVKVLDFGLAKALAPVSDPIGTAVTVTATDDSPRLLGPGTPAYMSPEQARGLTVDRRTDVWAFGCVLYELLTGERPFSGDRTSEVVARILEREPDFTALPADTPQAVRRLLRRCLQKDPQRRLRDVGDARLELHDALAPEIEPPRPPPSRRSRGMIAGAVGLAVVASVVTWSVVAKPTPAESKRVTRFLASTTAGGLSSGRARRVAISADGSRFAYGTSRGIVVRFRDRLAEIPLQESSLASVAPFFSPDGEWVAYIDEANLYKVPVAGGAPVLVADVGPNAIGSWSGADVVFTNVHGLFRVPADGGTPQKIKMADLDPTEQATHPEVLPGRHAVIFTVIPSRTVSVGAAAANPRTRIEALDLDSGRRSILVHGGSAPRYLPTGHLLYTAGGSLYAVPFDATRLETRGDAVPVVADVLNSQFAAADDGTLVYMTGTTSDLSTLVWVDRQGREEALDAPPRSYVYPRLSPDGTRIALDVNGPEDRDIWIWDLRRKALERFTLDPAGNPLVAWSPDGKRIAFGSDRFGPTNLFIQAADRSSDAERLITTDQLQMPISFTPDGRLLFSEAVPKRGRDIQALSLDGSGQIESLVHTAAQDGNAEVSPDGRWLAYDSNESGQFEVYVRPYPDVDRARWPVSFGGGRQPLWSHDGRELFYRDFTGAVLSVPVVMKPQFVAGQATEIVKGSTYGGGGSTLTARTYDLSLDGRRFLMLKRAPSAGTVSLVVVLDWFEELKRLAPVR